MGGEARRPCFGDASANFAAEANVHLRGCVDPGGRARPADSNIAVVAMMSVSFSLRGRYGSKRRWQLGAIIARILGTRRGQVRSRTPVDVGIAVFNPVLPGSVFSEFL
jgi:hypothetical protein